MKKINLTKTLAVFVAAPLLLAACDERIEVGEKSMTFVPTILNGQPVASRTASSEPVSYMVCDTSDITLECVVSDQPLNAPAIGQTRGISNTTSSLEQAGSFLMDGYQQNTVYFSNQAVNRTSGEWKIASDQYYWPREGNGLSVYGWYPNKNNLSNITYDLNQGASFKYNGSSTVAEGQKDLIYAFHGPHLYTDENANTPVPLVFRHVLSNIQFQIGTMFKGVTINTVTIKDVAPDGTCATSGGATPTFSWTPTGDAVTMSQSYGYETTEPYLSDSSNPILGDGTNSESFFLVPQTLTGKAISVNYTYPKVTAVETAGGGYTFNTENVTKNTGDIPLSESWEPGKCYTYRLTKTLQPGEVLPYVLPYGEDDPEVGGSVNIDGQGFFFDSSSEGEGWISSLDATGVNYVRLTWDEVLQNNPGKTIAAEFYLREKSDPTITTRDIGTYTYGGSTYNGIYTVNTTSSHSGKVEYIFKLDKRFKEIELCVHFLNNNTGGKSVTWRIYRYPMIEVLPDPA